MNAWTLYKCQIDYITLFYFHSFLNILLLCWYQQCLTVHPQCCLLVHMTSRRRTTTNQRWNNVVNVNVGIYNVKQSRINVVYFNVHMNNVRQRWNNVIFNVEFHNVWQRRNNVVKMTNSKKNKKNFKLNTSNSKFFQSKCKLQLHNHLPFICHFERNISRNICKATKKIMKNTVFQELNLNRIIL